MASPALARQAGEPTEAAISGCLSLLVPREHGSRSAGIRDKAARFVGDGNIKYNQPGSYDKSGYKVLRRERQDECKLSNVNEVSEKHKEKASGKRVTRASATTS